MEAITFLIDFILHIDAHLTQLVAAYGPWIYAILFLIVFCETGLVVTPFLPGDSLLFVAGALAAMGQMNPHLLVLLLIVAAILGDATNYAIGRNVGMRLFGMFPRLLKQSYLDKTHAFYERHGGKTIIFARFVPIVRTFAPFVAGIGKMHYPQFLKYNVVGAIAWVVGFVYAGYFFGNQPFVRKNLELLIFGIIFVSLLPGIIEIVRHKRASLKA
ncbi:DedA family protein [Chromobacterium amazonense]|uniref:DedA family protein n=1 Tax=Chromobacterium amazonense TaxID=1382803 RepID=UPI0031F6794B